MAHRANKADVHVNVSSTMDRRTSGSLLHSDEGDFSFAGKDATGANGVLHMSALETCVAGSPLPHVTPLHKSRSEPVVGMFGSLGHGPAGRLLANHATSLAPELPSKEIAAKNKLLGPHFERLFKDRVFKESDWSAHVSFRRFLPEPVVFLKVVVILCLPVTWVTLIAMLCGVYQGAIRRPTWWSLDDVDFDFAYSLGSFALSLLLVFKTNTSYARFWEARMAWGRIYTHCRVYIMRAQAYAPHAPITIRKLLLRWTIALPYLMRTHLLDYKPGADSLEDLLTPEEIHWVRSSPPNLDPHQPLAAINFHAALLGRLGLSDFLRADMTALLQAYINDVGVCERIARTPIPMPYSRHTTRFLLFFVTFMPLALWHSLGYATIAAAPLITVLLAGIENIGVMIENPMMTLPMAAYCATIHNNVLSGGEVWASGLPATGANALVAAMCASEPPTWQQDVTGAGAASMQARCSGPLSDPEQTTPAAYKLSLPGLRNDRDSLGGLLGREPSTLFGP